jgi:hypothetical protein
MASLIEIAYEGGGSFLIEEAPIVLQPTFVPSLQASI